MSGTVPFVIIIIPAGRYDKGVYFTWLYIISPLPERKNLGKMINGGQGFLSVVYQLQKEYWGL